MAGGIVTDVVKLTSVDRRLRPNEDMNETTEEFRNRLLALAESMVKNTAHDVHAAQSVGPKDRPITQQPGDAHVEEFFGNAADSYFPNCPDDKEDEIVRGGYIEAIEMATFGNAAKPIVSYWIITDGARTCPQVFVANTPLEVHVLILTPRPNEKEKQKDLNKFSAEEMFVVDTTARIDGIVNKYFETDPSKYPGQRRTAKGGTGIECLQVVRY
jgi:hypothetical protein